MLLDINTVCSDMALVNFFAIIKNVLKILQIAGPILAIIGIAITLVLLMNNPDDKKLKGRLRNTIVALFMVFFIPLIINVTMDLLDDNFSFSACWNFVEKSEISSGFYFIEDTSDPKKQILIDPDEYETGEKKEPSSGTGASSYNPSTANATNFLNSLNSMSRKVVMDRHNGKKWTYSNSNTKNNFSIADKSTKSTNCALYVVWGLIDVGVIDNGDRFYKAYRNGRNYISWGTRAEKKLKERMYIIDTNNRTASSLIRSGELQAGDIVLWYNHQHTNVYAGNNKWYDAGRQGGVNGSGPGDNYKFTTLGPFKLNYWMGEKVWRIMRIK